MTLAGLYIHVPFCTSVCPYCDFAVTIAGEDRRESFLDALEREAAGAPDHRLSFDTVYIGGGTPSSLTIGQIERILATVGTEFDLAPETVSYLEINPDDVDSGVAAEWRDLGFSYASLGVQSFDDDELSFLGRGHDGGQARRAAEILLAAGFSTVSVDLIFGLPGQSTVRWRRQLETVLELGVHHLSCYQLTIHGGTVFGNRRSRGDLDELCEDAQAELYLLTHDVLRDAGWEAYEVSNFAAAPEHRSKHNQKYWTHSPYLGLGPSAHSFAGHRRWWNRRKVRLWTHALESGRSPIEGEETLDETEIFFEAVMLGLRTAGGIDLDRLRGRFGPEAAALDELSIERFVASGHLRCDGPLIRPTPRGMAVAEALARSVLP